MRKVLVKLVVSVANDMDTELLKKLTCERLCTEDTMVLLAEVNNVDLRGEANYRALRALGEGE